MVKGPATTSVNNYRYVYLVAFLSVLFLTFLVSTTQPRVFYSGDGGLKYLVVKQFTEGHGFKYLYLPQPQWVRQIWESGYFPFRPPFVYPSPNGYLVVFPPAFQIITSFFYAHFGYAGLYIIPFVSTLLLWLGFILLLRRCDVRPDRIAIGMVILVFCSPMTIYGAVYWEHMTATLLLFCGLSFLVKPSNAHLTAAVLGLLSGLAAWFRPEAMMMNALYGLALVILFLKDRSRTTIVFLVAMAIGVGSFLLFNKLEFDSFLGIHSRQMLTNSIEDGAAVNHFRNLGANNWINTRHFLFILLLIPAIYVWRRYQKHLDRRTLLLLGIVLAYSILTPFLVPNDGGRQWGARYFLPTITVALVALLLIDKEWKLRYPLWLAAILLLFAAYDFEHNSYAGGIRNLPWENRHRAAPMMDFVNNQPGNVVVVSLPYIAMELGCIFDKKYFFLAPDDSSLQQLLPQLKQNGVTHYTYIYDIRLPGIHAHKLTDTIAAVNWPRDNGDYQYHEYAIP